MPMSPTVKWGVPVVVLSVLVILFLIFDPLDLMGPEESAKVASEPPIAARKPVVEEVVTSDTGDHAVDPHRVAAADSVPDSSTGLDPLNGIGGWDVLTGTPPVLDGEVTESDWADVAAEQATDSGAGQSEADMGGAGAPGAVASDAAAVGSGAIADGISAARPTGRAGRAGSEGAGSGARAHASSGGDAISVAGDVPPVGAPGPGEADAVILLAAVDVTAGGSAAFALIPALGGHARDRFPGSDVAAAASRLAPGLRSIANSFDQLEPCDILGADCVGTLDGGNGIRFITPPWTPWQPARLP